jgi:predicted aspartyl protease
MAAIRGSFADGAPVVSITVQTAASSISLMVIIETGFDGFAAVPASVATALALTTDTAAEMEYADGTTDTVALAVAQIVLGVEVRDGLVHVHPDTVDALVGLDFLRAFRKVLVLSVTQGQVILVDDLAEIVATQF